MEESHLCYQLVVPASLVLKFNAEQLHLLGLCNNHMFANDAVKGRASKKRDAVVNDFLVNFNEVNITPKSDGSEIRVTFEERRRCLAVLILRWWLRKCNLREAKAVVVEAAKIVKASARVFADLGTDHRESVYQKALQSELLQKGCGNPLRENEVPLYYPTKPPTMDRKEAQKLGYVNVGEARIDIEVGDWVLELKQMATGLNTKERGQLYKYLQHTTYTQGLLINFHQRTGRIDWTYQYQKDI